MANRDWLRVSRRHPCKVCGRADYCTFSADGSVCVCMRVESQRPSSNKLGGWLHRIADPRPVQVTSLPKRPRPRVDWTEAARQMYRSGAEERARLANELGLQVVALEQLMVGAGFDRFRSLTFSSWPERDSTGKVVGIVRRYRDGAKKTMQDSSHGLYFGAQPFAMPGPVFLPEGGSDTCALLGMGLNAVGRPSNTGGIDELAKLLKDVSNVIVVLGERDKKTNGKCQCGVCMLCWPGWAGAKLTAERLSAALKRHVAIKMFPRAKDARDWAQQRERVTAVDALHALYEPEKDRCRVCFADGPHEERRKGARIEVVCRECRTLLENKRV